jgi:hypothetical protein
LSWNLNAVSICISFMTCLKFKTPNIFVSILPAQTLRVNVKFGPGQFVDIDVYKINKNLDLSTN